MWGIQITETYLSAVLVEHVDKKFSVFRRVQAQLDEGIIDSNTGTLLDASRFVQTLGNLFRAENIHGSVNLILPETAYVSRMLHVPPMKPQELAKVIRNELSRYAAYRGTDFLFDYTAVPVGVQLAVYTSSIKRDILTAYRTAVRKAGCSVALVGDSLQSAVRALSFTDLDKTHRPCIAVMSKNMIWLAIADDVIETSSTIDMGQTELENETSVALLASRIKSALAFFEQELSVELGDLFIFTEKQVSDDQGKDLAIRIDRPVHFISPGQDGAFGIDVGAAMLFPSRTHAYNNLLSHVVAQHADHKRKWIAATAFLVLSNAALGITWQPLTTGFARIRQQETITGTALLAIQQETQQFDTLQTQATDLKAKLDAFAKTKTMTANDFSAADLRMLANAVPNNMTIVRFTVTGNSLAIEGTTTTYAAIGQLMRSWTATKLVQAGAVQSVRADNGYHFRCDFQVTKGGQS
jgi:Tfp pilus assembly protein PilN